MKEAGVYAGMTALWLLFVWSGLMGGWIIHKLIIAGSTRKPFRLRYLSRQSRMAEMHAVAALIEAGEVEYGEGMEMYTSRVGCMYLADGGQYIDFMHDAALRGITRRHELTVALLRGEAA